MMKERLNSNAASLRNASFGNYVAEYSIEEMLQSGMLVKVTAWVRHEMGFSSTNVRVHAAITATLWRTIISVPTFCRSWQTIRGRGNEVVWIAAWALRLARQRGVEVAKFPVFLPASENDDQPNKQLRAEWCHQQSRDWIVIGHCEEFSISVVPTFNSRAFRSDTGRAFTSKPGLLQSKILIFCLVLCFLPDARMDYQTLRILLRFDFFQIGERLR